MENEIAYCFVVDKNSRPLAPTKVNKGWYLVRKGRAKIKSRYPMVIQLEKEVEYDKYDESRIVASSYLQHCPRFCVNRKLEDSSFILESCFQI